MARTAARIFDEYLVLSAKTGDRRAFELLARRWQKRLVAHAWRLTGDPDAARDAAQAGWLEIARGLGRLRDERAFPAWAYRIVSRCCTRQIAGAKRRRLLFGVLEHDPVAPEADLDLLGSSDLRTAIRALPPDQRTAIALVHFEDMTIAEAAVALDVPAGTVKTRLMHARRKLRAALEGEE
jgi:RNA polymerase sigma factor (sigma-70 family)